MILCRARHLCQKPISSYRQRGAVDRQHRLLCSSTSLHEEEEEAKGGLHRQRKLSYFSKTKIPFPSCYTQIGRLFGIKTHSCKCLKQPVFRTVCVLTASQTSTAGYCLRWGTSLTWKYLCFVWFRLPHIYLNNNVFLLVRHCVFVWLFSEKKTIFL